MVPEHIQRYQINLAISFPVTFQGKFEEAEPLFIRLLAIDEKVHGPDHPEVSTDLNNLAALLKVQVRAIRVLKLPAIFVGSTLVGESVVHG